MKLKNIKILIFTIVLAFLFSCSSNPNSTLNHSPKAVQEYIESKNNTYTATIKDKGKGVKDLVIFSTNDTLSAYNKNLSLSSIKYFIDNFDRTDNFVALVDTGNFSAGSEEAENSKGRSAIEIMNKVGYDIVVPGSYEFNYGIDTFFDNMYALKSDVVCCNIYDIKRGGLPFPPYVIYRYNDLNVGFVGVTSPETLFLKENHEKFYDENGEQILYFFEDEDGTALYKQVQAAVNAAKTDGADKIVLLAHLGIEGITERWTSTRVIANTKDIDAVIDGHSMEVLDNGLMVNKVGAFIPLVQAGSEYKYLGAINITKENYIYPAVMKERSVNKKDENFQKVIDEILSKYKSPID